MQNLNINKLPARALAVAVVNKQVEREEIVRARHTNTVKAMDRHIESIKDDDLGWVRNFTNEDIEPEEVEEKINKIREGLKKV